MFQTPHQGHSDHSYEVSLEEGNNVSLVLWNVIHNTTLLYIDDGQAIIKILHTYVLLF